MTTTGVKPKMISNIISIMLLFLFVTTAYSNDGFELKGDTIILDGEVIEMEKKEVKTNVDSLQKVESTDFKNPPKQWRFFGSVDYQIGTHFASIEIPNSNLIELSDFLGSNSSPSLGMAASGKFGLDLSDYISIYSRFFWGNYGIKSFSIDESSLSDDDSRVSFENNNGILYERYVLFIDPGFEERFEEVSTSEKRIGVRVAGIGVNTRFYTTGKDNKIAPFIDLGAMWRIHKMLDDDAVYSITENGLWSKSVITKAQANSSAWFAQLGLGCLFELRSNRHLEATLVYEGLPRSLYSTSSSSRNSSFTGIRLGYTFSFFK